jgi:hypothetical protein
MLHDQAGHGLLPSEDMSLLNSARQSGPAKAEASGVMSLSRGSLVIADVAKLAIVAGFDDNYLHRRIRRPPAGREL